ncbi:MAG: TfoX/Sxy family protein [Acidimicrobiales bacterium]|nr:TfoX/Sxy family protein [Acidimicrobiia bacterium]NNF56393.1 TfoX/Sxy family protein [Acidimicrobiales bacterium]
MGEKGAKTTGDAAAAAEHLVDALQSLGAVRSKKMFGGFGIFCDDVMFGLVDSAGAGFFRAADEQIADLEANGSVGHGRMPYWSISQAELSDEDALVARASVALETARAAKKK